MNTRPGPRQPDAQQHCACACVFIVKCGTCRSFGSWCARARCLAVSVLMMSGWRICRAETNSNKASHRPSPTGEVTAPRSVPGRGTRRNPLTARRRVAVVAFKLRINARRFDGSTVRRAEIYLTPDRPEYQTPSGGAGDAACDIGPRSRESGALGSSSGLRRQRPHPVLHDWLLPQIGAATS